MARHAPSLAPTAGARLDEVLNLRRRAYTSISFSGSSPWVSPFFHNPRA